MVNYLKLGQGVMKFNRKIAKGAKLPGASALGDFPDVLGQEKQPQQRGYKPKMKSIDRIIIENEIKLIYGVKKRGKAKKRIKKK